MRLQYKVFICVLPVMLLGIIGLGLWSSWKAKRGLYENAYRDMSYALRIVLEDQLDLRHNMLVKSGRDGSQALVSRYKTDVMNSLSVSTADLVHEFAIFTGAGKPIFSTHLSDLNALAAWTQTALTVKSAPNQKMVGELVRTGQPVLFAAQYFAPWDWVVFISVSRDLVTAPVDSIRTATLAVAAVCTFLTFLLLLFVLQHLLSRPIGTLQDAALRISRQETLETIPVQSKDELGELARRMESMSGAIGGFITDLKSTGAALEESESRFRDFAEVASDWFWETDAAFRFTFVSDRIEEIVGISPQDILGKTRWEVGESLNKVSWEKHKADLFQHRAFRNFTYSFPEQEGTTVWVSVNGAPRFDGKGRFLGYRGTATNITARRMAEEDLHAKAEALARSNEELEQFAAVASHDLQEPLRKVQAFGERLDVKYSKVLDERGQDYLARILLATARMQNLVKDLLAYARVSTEGEAFVEVDLRQILDTVLQDLELRIQETGAQVTVGDLPLITADPLQIQQLFQNLVGNALKYRREDVTPTVQISAEVNLTERLDTWHKEPICQIHIKDNGIGFEDAYAERIFGIFQRLHGPGSFEGTGVGLAICRKIAERHGGTVLAYSKLGEGSTFTIQLPIHATHEGVRAA